MTSPTWDQLVSILAAFYPETKKQEMTWKDLDFSGAYFIVDE